MSLWHDARFGLRTLAKDRTSLFLAVIALALGIGSATAIFSVIDNVLLEPFPYTDGQRLVAIQIHDSASTDRFGREMFSPPEFSAYATENQIFDGTIGVYQDHILWTGPGAPESWLAGYVTGNTFQFLGVAPLAGRATSPADAQPSAAPVFVMSYKLWQRDFAGNPAIIGQSFTLDGQARTLVGIMPKRFAWWGADVWIPTRVNAADTDLSAQFFFLLGHLKPGLTPKNAIPSIRILAQHLSAQYPKLYPKRFDVQLPTLSENVVGRFTNTLYLALAAVGLLLLIACANVANLLLAKATAREKEFAIRGSLGASKWRVVRQLLLESALLGLCGAAFGCLVAWLGLKALMAALPQSTFPDEANITLNLRVLAATVVVALLTALLFGLAPALASFSTNLIEPLKAGGRGNSGFRRGRLRQALIVSEVALSIILLMGAGLLMRSFLLQMQADLGFGNQQQLIESDVTLGKHYKNTEQQARFARDLSTRLLALPGVANATVALDFPPFGAMNSGYGIAGVTRLEKSKGLMGFVDARFFSTLGVRLLRGRFLTDDDVLNKRKEAVVNETLARKYFPGRDPIGQRIKLEDLEDKVPNPVPAPWFEIVGVSSDLRNHNAHDDALPEVYAPLTITGVGEYIVFLRAFGNPAPLAKQLDGAIISLDKSIHPQETMPLNAALDRFQYAQQRFALQIFSVFAALALVLVAIGVFSVVSYTVSQQNREIGIRMALGAPRSNVRNLVISSGMRFILIGIVSGVIAGVFLLRLAQSQLGRLTTYDPITLLSVVAILALIGLLACYLPSRRAIRVDPLIALRDE